MSSFAFRGAIALILVSLTSPGQAAFQAPKIISDTGTDQQQVAMNAQGAAIIVWRHFNADAGYYEIQGRRRSATGVLGLVRTLSVAAPDTKNPKAAIDKSGNAYIVWRGGQTTPNLNTAYGRAWPAGGTPGPIRMLSEPDGAQPDPDVAVGDSGPAVTVWSHHYLPPDNYNAVQTRTLAANSTLGAVTDLSKFGGLNTINNGVDPHIAMAPNGAAVVAWSIGNPGYDAEIQARLRSSAGAWGDVQQLTPANDCPPPDSCGDWNNYPQVAMSAKGAIVVWYHWSGGGERALPLGATTIEGRFAPAGGAFGAIQNLSGAPIENIREYSPSVAMGGSGKAVIVWGRQDLGTNLEQRVQARLRNPNGTLGTIQNLSAGFAPVEGLAPRVAMSAADYAVVVWQMRNPNCVNNCQDAYARARLITGSWTPVENLPVPDTLKYYPTIAVDGKGDALAVWGGDGIQGRTYAAVSSNPPPTISISAPLDGATFAQNAVVNASYTCADEAGGPGLKSCTGTAANGEPIDTSTPGSHSFTVKAVDKAGASTSMTVHYAVQ